MPSATASSPAERYQALQQLETAYHQPDGNMFFTYNGAAYRSVGINGDGTMRVIDQTTGQMLNLDPVEVYSAARAASGDPVPPPPAPPSPSDALTAQAPSMFSNAMSQIGTYSSLLNMASQIKGVKAFLSHIPKFGVVLGAVTAFLSAYQLFQGVQSLYKNGFSWGGFLGLAGSFVGVATGVNIFLAAIGNSALGAFSNPAGWLVAGAVISASFMDAAINDMIMNGVSVKGVVVAAAGFVMTALFTYVAVALIFGVASFGIAFLVAALAALAQIIWSILHPPDPATVAMRHLSKALNPIIWTPGPLIVVAVGTVAILMGWAKNQTPPAMASLTVPAYYVNQVLAASGAQMIDLTSKTPSLIVEPGDGRVVIVSPIGNDSRGNLLVSLKAFSLAKNLQFVSSPNIPPDGAYIPFFLFAHGKLSTDPNPTLVNALEIQDRMLQAVLSGTLLTHDALNAINVAAASNKYGVRPDN